MGEKSSNGSLLPPELLEAQIGQVELLLAMYPGEGCVEMSDIGTTTLDALREAIAEGSLPDATPRVEELDLVLDIEVAPEPEQSPRNVQLSITVPLYYGGDVPAEPPPAKVRLQQPSWMTKASVVALMNDLPEEEDLFATIENISAAVSVYLSQPPEDATSTPHSQAEALTRVWFYFPSISTRAKRDDLVNHAPGYGLTGFLLAGKPGILCLEGGSQAVDDYMKFIKTESWGDIPAHHKKVSERYRQQGIEARAFGDMQEITGELERRGERANRNDMRALEAWLSERGLQEAFAKVLI